MNNVTLVFTANDHPLAARLIRLQKTRGSKFLHRNATEWEGNIAPCKAVAVEDRESPKFTFREYNENNQIVEVQRSLAEVYENAGIPVRVLKRRKPEQLVIDVEADAATDEAVQIALSTRVPQSQEGRRAKREKAKKAGKRKL